MSITIDANKMHYRELNARIKEHWQAGENSIILHYVNGHRYIGDALHGSGEITIQGVPGNDLAVFMDGPNLVVQGNIQDAAANTMNSGSIVVHGAAGDTLAYGMRGGEIYVRDCVGYRAGIHMKEYGEHKPVLVVGGVAGDFLGEYMAGGIIMILNLDGAEKAVGNYCGSGMHGGVIFIRGNEAGRTFKGTRITHPDEVDCQIIEKHLQRFQNCFQRGGEIKADEFIKISAAQLRPYENLYVGV